MSFLTAERGNRWKIIVHPDAPGPLDAPADAIAAAPAAVYDAAEPLLPRQKTDRLGTCRICGERVSRTREHVPVKSSTSGGKVRSHTIEEWLNRSGVDDLPGGTVEQGGPWGYSLCEPCNNNPGSWYGPEYGRWTAAGVSLVRALPPIADLDKRTAVGVAEIGLQRVRPGAFVRAVLAGMCTVAASWDLTGQHPVIKDMLLNKSAAPLPEPLSLHMAMYLGPMGRLIGPTLMVDRLSGEWMWLAEMAHPPWAFVMVLACGGPRPELLDISEFTERAPDAVLDYEAHIDVGFGHTPLPGDYRPAGALGNDRWGRRQG